MEQELLDLKQYLSSEIDEGIELQSSVLQTSICKEALMQTLARLKLQAKFFIELNVPGFSFLLDDHGQIKLEQIDSKLICQSEFGLRKFVFHQTKFNQLSFIVNHLTEENMNELENQTLDNFDVKIGIEIGDLTISAKDLLSLEGGEAYSIQYDPTKPVVINVAGEEIGRGRLYLEDGEVYLKIVSIGENLNQQDTFLETPTIEE